jgi:hypothetical protein
VSVHETALSERRGNRWRSHAYQAEVCLFLRDWGFLDARTSRRQEPGDLAGVPGYVLTVRAPEKVDLSSSLDAVVQAAAQAPHSATGAAVFARRGRPVDESYVVIQLSDFADLMARCDGQPGGSLSDRIRPRTAVT